MGHIKSFKMGRHMIFSVFRFPGFVTEPDPENPIYVHHWNPQVKPDRLVPLPLLQLPWVSHNRAKRARTGKPVLKPDRTGSGFFCPSGCILGVTPDLLVPH